MPILEVKNDLVYRRLLTNAYDVKLIALYESFADIFPWFRRLIVSGYRPWDIGVHGTNPCRGLDLRCRSGWVGEYIEKKMKGWWSYDIVRPEKLCVMYHEEKPDSGYHLHLQVHPNTKFIGNVTGDSAPASS